MSFCLFHGNGAAVNGRSSFRKAGCRRCINRNDVSSRRSERVGAGIRGGPILNGTVTVHWIEVGRSVTRREIEPIVKGLIGGVVCERGDRDVIPRFRGAVRIDFDARQIFEVPWNVAGTDVHKFGIGSIVVVSCSQLNAELEFIPLGEKFLNDIDRDGCMAHV